MKGKIAGIPVVLIVLAAIIIAPLLYVELVILGKLNDVNNAVIQTRVSVIRATVQPVEPTATPSATATPMPKGLTPVRTVVPVAPTK